MNLPVLLRCSQKSGRCRSVLLHWQQRWSGSYGTSMTNNTLGEYVMNQKLTIDECYIYCKRCGHPFLTCQWGWFCDFHFSFRLNLARLDEVLFGTETVCCAINTPFCRGSLWHWICVLEWWYLSSHMHLSSTHWPSDSVLDSRLKCFLICCLVSGNFKRKGTEE